MKLKFSTTPWKHQLAALKYFMPRSHGALYTDMGSGKTKIMIDLIVNRGFKRTLIVCPKKVCDTWVDEISKHAFNTPICTINVSDIAGDKRAEYIGKALADAKADQVVIISNYESVWRSPFKEYLIKKGKLDCIICDESHRIKAAGSKVSRGLYQIGKKVENKYLVTGTPLGQSPLDIYAQYRFMDDSIFGTNFTLFQNEYANMVPLGATGITVLNNKNPYKDLDRLKEKMFSCAFMMESDVVLPDTEDVTIPFILSDEAQEYYKELKKEGCLELEKGTLTTGNILAVTTRLQQLTSGYIPLEDDDGNQTMEEVDTSRREAFRKLLKSFPKDEPIVVFAKYKKDIKNIRKVVKEEGRKSSELSGSKNTMKNWVDGKTDVLVIQIASGAEGINGLTKSKYCVYYSLHHSLTLWKQSRKRQHRPGQTRSVTYYTLVAKMHKGKTIDERILEGLKNNQNYIDMVMDGGEI